MCTFNFETSGSLFVLYFADETSPATSAPGGQPIAEQSTASSSEQNVGKFLFR